MFFRNLLVAAALIAVGLPIAARSDEAIAKLTGTVRTTSGAPVAGADVTVSGIALKHTVSDASGAFAVALPPGLYRLTVVRGGYLPAQLDSLALFSGETQNVDVVLQSADLSSLRTIAHVTVGRASAINTGAASISVLPREEITNLAAPQINDVIQRIPGASLEKGSSSPNTSISLGGSQPYETQVLIDGHPLSAGRYGVWFSQFFNSYLLGGIETQIGPGNTTALAGTAVGGTANLTTPNFTSKREFSFITGIDNFGSQYSALLTSGRAGRLSYVLGGAYGSENGLYHGRQGCVLNPATKNTWQTGAPTGIIQFCGDLGSAFFSKGEIVKARYDFSPVTSFEVGFIGSQAGYLPQATSYGVYAGLVKIVNCLPGGIECTAPSGQQYVGKTIDGYFFYPGSNVYNNQPLFTAQLRTAIGNNTLLLRPYAGNIARIIDGSGEANYANYWYPSSQPSSACSGIVGTTVVSGNQSLTACNNKPFSLLESDKLRGNTLEFLHPFGANLVTFTYDFHTDETFAYYNSPANVATPDTLAHFNQLSLTGSFALNPMLDLKVGLYDSLWALSGSQTGTVSGSGGGKPTVTTVGLTRTVGRFDPHVALTFSPKGGLSYRAAYGTSTTFPYASLVSGTSFVNQASGTGGTVNTLVQKNPGLAPERAYELDLGVDKRFGRNTIVSFDYFNSQIHDVFEILTSPVVNPNYSLVQQPLNAAKLDSQFAMLTIRNQPETGFGYYATATLARSVVDGIPLSFYPSKGYGIPANGVQQCSDGGTDACIPYFKAYARVEYTTKAKDYFGLGMDLEGKNNTYFQPPFALFDFTVRHPLNKTLTAQISVQNLLNTNVFAGLVQPNSGVAISGENSAGQLGAYGGSGLQYPLVPATPRTVRFQLQYALGKQP
ncbi:MAG: TonB-dependent receptor [bacterium]|nr:TonB-dependent receptor [bacterium]